MATPSAPPPPASPAPACVAPPPAQAAQPLVVIPDCCNIGVVGRVLVAVNLAVLAAMMARGGAAKSWGMEYLEAAMLVEWSTLISLFGLCLLRSLLLEVGWLERVPRAAQRALCALLPALVTGGVVRFLMLFEWYAASFGHLKPLQGMALAALFGLVMQHYFELRARAFSPVLVESRLQALQARIRPHFLFNSLNAVLSLIRTEPRRAETALEDLADLFRVLMRDSRDMTSLEDEIRLCRQYLSIEKIRLGERLHVQWDAGNLTESVLRQAQVSALLLQPLLENAVHYGVEPASAPCTIKVRLGRFLDRIEIVVSNPVHGEKAGRGGGNKMALNNIRERLALLYDVEAQLSFGEADGQFEVKLRFPYVKGATVRKRE